MNYKEIIHNMIGNTVVSVDQHCDGAITINFLNGSFMEIGAEMTAWGHAGLEFNYERNDSSK